MTYKMAVLAMAPLLLLTTIFHACDSASRVVKPSVTVIPQGWYLAGQDEYGYYEEIDGTKWGMVEYIDDSDGDFVQIYYGDVPKELKNRESDPDALKGRAVLESATFDVDEMFTITISGRLAACAKGYDDTWDTYDMETVFVYESTCIDIYSCCDATYEDEAQVMSLIESITFND
jgi:hypothetical protein